MKDNFEGADPTTPSSGSSTYQPNSNYGYNPNAYNPSAGQNNQYSNGGYYSTGEPAQSEPQYNGYNTNQDLGQQTNPYGSNPQQNQGYSPYQTGNGVPNGYQQNANYNGQYMNQQYANQQYTNQQYANQQYSGNNYGTGMPSDYNQVNSELKPKKKSHKALWGLTALPVLAIALVVAFFFIPPFQNFVYKNILGTKQYYAHIESTCDEKIKNEFMDVLSTANTDTSEETSYSGSFSFSLNSSLTEELGFNPADFTCDYTSASKDKQATSSLTLKYQGTELMTAESYVDLSDNSIYLKLPTFSDKYIDYTALISQLNSSELIDSDLSSSLLNLSVTNTTSSDYDTVQQITQKLSQELDSDTVSKLLTDYSDFILEEIKDHSTIKLEESTDFVVSGSKQKCDVFTLSVSEEDALTILKDIINKLKEDETIREICKNVMGTDYMYTSTLEELLSELDDTTDIDKENDSFLTMTVYTDGDEILGRKFTISEEEEELSLLYGMLTSDTASAFIFELRNETADTAVGVSMDADKKGDTYDGTINMYAEDQTYAMYFTGVGITDENLITGSFRLPIDSDEITLDFATDNSKQNMKITVKADGSELGSLSITGGKDETSNFNYPDITDDSIAQLTDSASVAAYIDADKLESFIQTIYDTFNLPATATSKELADEVLTSIADGTFFSSGISSDDIDDYSDDYSDYYGGDSTTSGSYNPEDYGLPAGTEIDESGYYNYNLSAEEIEALKQQGSDYNAFSKTYTEMQSYLEQMAEKLCGTTENAYSTDYNYVYGNVTNNTKDITHKTNITWYSLDGADVTICYDTLTNQLLSITMYSSDVDSIQSYIKDIYSKLGLTAIPDDTMNQISSALKEQKEFDQYYTFSDSYIYLYNYGETDNGSKLYNVTIQKDDSYY